MAKTEGRLVPHREFAFEESPNPQELTASCAYYKVGPVIGEGGKAICSPLGICPLGRVRI